MAKNTTPDSLYGNSRDILREAERENEILADIAGEEYESPGDIPKGKYVIEKRLLDAAQKKNELLEAIAEGSGSGSGAAKAIGIDYATDIISLKNKDGDVISGSGATLPAYGVSFDPTTGGLTLTKNGTAVSGQTVTIPNYGSPVGVTDSADMVDEGAIYLYEGETGGGFTNGHFYYYDGSAWADGGEYAAATVQTDKTLLVEDRAADAKATGEAVGELKTQLEDEKSSVLALQSAKINGKTAVESNSADVLLTGKNLYVPKITNEGTIIKGRNRFNNSTATFTMSGYSSSNIITKENNGIKIVSTTAAAGTFVYAYSDYIAEFDGELYLSCDARCDGRNTDSAKDLIVMIILNGVSQEKIYGDGLLFERVTVQQGDTVRLCFYSHANTTPGNTVYYKNIMLSYGGLYEYVPYISDDSSEKAVHKTKTINVPSGASDWKTETIPGSSDYACSTNDVIISDMLTYPASSSDVADITVTGSLNVISVTQVLQKVEGIAVNTNGKLFAYHEGMGRTAFAEWLAQHPVTITYTSTEYETITVDLLSRTYIEGERIIFSENTPFVYYKDERPIESKIVCFGDSITGMFANGADYPNMITLSSDCEAINAGFAGCRWTDHASTTYLPFSMNRLADAVYNAANGNDNAWDSQDSSALVNPESASYNPLYAEHLANLKSVNWHDVKFVTLLWGLNDFYSSVIINSSDDSSASDKQHSNVEDAVSYTINKLLTAYPHLRIIVITPYWCTSSGVDTDTATDNNGKKLIDFVNKIAEVSENVYHVPVIPMYKTTGANIINKWYFQKDDAHPTERLKWIIAHRIINAIELDS